MSEQRKPVALIIGMGRGLSAALAMRFAQGGFAIAGFARNPDASAELAATMAERGHQVVLRAVDASDAGSLTQAIAAIEAELGPVEVLIYNAYRATIGLPSEVPVDQVVEDFRVNVAGALAAIHAVLPGMRQRGKGSILLTGGGLALDPTGWLPAASLAIGKAGIRNFAQTLHKELSETGIRVATVTITGQIAPQTAFDPYLIAQTYWQLHDAAGPLPVEVIFTGQAQPAAT